MKPSIVYYNVKSDFSYLNLYDYPNKVRLGKANKGGYVIADEIGEYDYFLSGGIADDDSFEMALLNKCQNLYGTAFDGSIPKLPQEHERLSFDRRHLGQFENKKYCNLHSYFNKYNNMIIKLNIDGGETDLFYGMRDYDMNKIKQLVITFHSARQGYIPMMLNKTHYLVHLHAINSGGYVVANKVDIPNIFECTYVRKNCVESLQLNTEPLPTAIDMPNDPDKDDIKLTTRPYVH